MIKPLNNFSPTFKTLYCDRARWEYSDCQKSVISNIEESLEDRTIRHDFYITSNENDEDSIFLSYKVKSEKGNLYWGKTYHIGKYGEWNSDLSNSDLKYIDKLIGESKPIQQVQKPQVKVESIEKLTIGDVLSTLLVVMTPVALILAIETGLVRKFFETPLMRDAWNVVRNFLLDHLLT